MSFKLLPFETIVANYEAFVAKLDKNKISAEEMKKIFKIREMLDGLYGTLLLSDNTGCAKVLTGAILDLKKSVKQTFYANGNIFTNALSSVTRSHAFYAQLDTIIGVTSNNVLNEDEKREYIDLFNASKELVSQESDKAFFNQVKQTPELKPVKTRDGAVQAIDDIRMDTQKLAGIKKGVTLRSVETKDQSAEFVNTVYNPANLTDKRRKEEQRQLNQQIEKEKETQVAFNADYEKFKMQMARYQHEEKLKKTHKDPVFVIMGKIIKKDEAREEAKEKARKENEPALKAAYPGLTSKEIKDHKYRATNTMVQHHRVNVEFMQKFGYLSRPQADATVEEKEVQQKIQLKN